MNVKKFSLLIFLQLLIFTEVKADTISSTYKACRNSEVVNNSGLVSESLLNQMGTRKAAEALVMRLATQPANAQPGAQLISIFNARNLNYLKTGLKNLHEVQTSGGINNPQHRDKVESGLLGAGISSQYKPGPIIQNELRPKYGLYFPPESFSKVTPEYGMHLTLKRYGDSLLFFQDEVRWRTTISFGDSFDIVHLEKTTHTGLPINYLNSKSWDEAIAEKPYRREPMFLEAHIWGKIDLSDIAGVALSDQSGQIDPQQLADAKALGIPVYRFNMEQLIDSIRKHPFNNAKIEKELIYPGDPTVMAELQKQRLLRATDRSHCH